ncbi:hypothetical protein BKA83DRAFT_28289 [Pisolithus microcarpus]|nr:hypothetical protein BKA83DRAFT_28289 [Pisolithus microcarpus]
MELLYKACCLTTHKHLPLHKIKKWNGKFFDQVTLKQLGLMVQVSHQDMVCHCPGCSHMDFVIIDVNGIHVANVNFCSSCTRRVLDHFLQLIWLSKVSAYEYYGTLEHLTDTTGINLPKSWYHAFLHMIHQFCHTKLFKRAGRASEQDGISTTKPGGLAMVCPACPQPGMNLPDDWKNTEPSKKFLYSLIIAIDVSFWLKNCTCSSGDKDPGVHTGLAYFVANGPYNKHVLWFAMQEDSMAHAETKFATGLCATEGYCNMDYIFFSAICPFLFLTVVISYDITCQWKLNLTQRIDQLPNHLHVPLTVVASSFMFGIPKFHVPAHAALCAIPHSLNLMPGAGCTDGKAVEHNWSEINCVTNSTKEMGCGAWHDTIDNHIGHCNFRKLVGLGHLLHNRLRAAVTWHSHHCAVLDKFNLAINSSQRETWMTMLTVWEADKSEPNPYITTQSFPTEAKVCSQLAADDKSVAARGKLSIHKMSPSGFIALGLSIEEIQRSLKLDVLNESQLGQRHACSADICAIESQLREAQCHDALAKLHNYLHTHAHFIKCQNTNIQGQRANTCTKTLIDNLSSKISKVIQRYQVAHAAILTLHEDICGPTASASVSKSQHKALRHGLGEGYQMTSWIWACGTVASALCVEWAKACAHAACWSEEVKLLEEEMWHTN